MARKPNTRSEPKSIILFSDGTGNSSAKVFKTNVWRMYEAVDLGPSPDGNRDQISFYDDGVGTSNFKFLAALGGAFGWGLKRNILDLYRYACRNFRAGDRIYAFGFSRGAFTIRLVIDLIGTQGLVQSRDDGELEQKSIAAYSAWRRKFIPRKLRWFFQREKDVQVVPTQDSKDILYPNIHFVGVWDTVAAYGGPIAEITRAIDNWIYLLSLPDYALHECVKRARHALAIDDERDAFHPLLWDEIEEERRANQALAESKAARAKAARSKSVSERKKYIREAEVCDQRARDFATRMQQVWFTGMHADVGGGYPDESLSYVSLLWMMEEAENAGLRTIPAIKDRFYALANSYGPMHNSRSGVGSYYRYQPRKIAAWVDWSDEKEGARYLMLRDPNVRDDQKRVRGLLRTIKVHESVIARINSGTVRYAPIALPRSFHVVPPQRKGETIEQTEDTARLKCRYDRPPSEPLISQKTRRLVEQDGSHRFDCQETLWDLVWWRRITYFATLAVTLLLVALPVWNPLPAVDAWCSDSRCWLRSLIRPAKALVPGFADPWVEAMATYPLTPLVLIAVIVLLLRLSGKLERGLSDGSYRLWRDILDEQPIAKCEETGLRSFREGAPYQKFFRWLKWSFLPLLAFIAMLLAIFYVPLVAIAQGVIWVDEGNHYFCPTDDRRKLRHVTRETFMFDTRSPCVAPNLILDKGQVYDMVFQLPVRSTGEPVGWKDGNIASKTGSLTRVRAETLPQVLGVPLRRVIEASYLQPLVQTVDVSNGSNFGRVRISKLELSQDQDWPELYRVRVRATDTSILHLFANDAYLPFVGSFYDNNCGVARVTIIKVVPRHAGEKPMTEPDPEPVPMPNCALPATQVKTSGVVEIGSS